MNLSRRGFFGSLGSRVLDDFRSRIQGSGLWPSRGETWIALGSISDFPPGTARVLASPGVTVHSDSEGIRVVKDGAHRPVRLEKDGKVSYQTGAVWPESAALSILTGERIQLGRS